MLISHRHQFIFIHILKTAGTSLSESLAPHARFMDTLVYGYRPTVKLFSGFNILMNRKGIETLTGFTKHATASSVKQKLPGPVYDTYFKFAFVRNPWDWMVSLYFYLCQNQRMSISRVVRQMSFSDFVKWRIEKQFPKQIDYITGANGNIIVDYVAKYENLQEEFNYIVNKLHIKASLPSMRNVSKLRSKRDYRTYYQEETCTIVGQYFKADIEKFNYKFE